MRLQKTEDDLAKMFICLAAVILLVGMSYFLLSHIFYNHSSDGIGGQEVFLVPRYLLKQNDLPTTIFNSIDNLVKYSIIVSAAVFFGLYLALKKKLPSFLFFIAIYLLALLVEFSFLGFTANGFLHLRLQSISINNGYWYSMNHLLDIPVYADASIFGKASYLFGTLCNNEAGYSIPGTTHPPGLFLIAFAIRKVGAIFPDVSVGWGIVVTMLNTIVIVFIALIAGSMFSRKTGRLTAIMLMTVPSVTMHFCAVLDGVATLFIVAGFWGIILAIKTIYGAKRNTSWSLFFTGLITGLSFTLAAQMTYGHVIPICVSLLSFYIVTRKSISLFSPFTVGLLIIPLSFFLFEYIISSGSSFYPIRALRIAHFVKTELHTRPYPLSQFGNFTVLSIMGGILFMPTVVNAFWFSAKTIKTTLLKPVSLVREGGSRRRIREFLCFTVLGTFTFLILQKTVRLEVERTWHWAFVPVWSLMGIYLLSIKCVFRRLFIKPVSTKSIMIGLFGLQLAISIIIAICIQDYY